MRQREDFKDGTLGADLLTTVTTIDFGSDPGFATIAAPDYATLIIDPEGAGNGPEIVYLTAYTATNTTGTIVRGREGTSDPGLTHASGTAWRHGPTVEDFDRFVWAWDSEDPSAVANVDIDISGFEAVQLTGWLKISNDNQYVHLSFSNDGGVSFRAGAADYGHGYLYDSLPSAHGALGDASDSTIEIAIAQGAAATERISFDLKVVGAADANVFTTVMGMVMHENYLGTHIMAMVAGMVFTEEVNDYIRFFPSAGTIASGRIAVYGYPVP